MSIYVRRAITILSAFALAVGTLLVPLASAEAASSPGVMVSLGDSVAAGYYASSVLDSSPYAAECARSSVNYPKLLGVRLGLSTYNLACSGATVAAGINGPQTVPTGGTPPTVSVPAQLTQAAALNKHIDRATVTVLANDVQWSYWLAQCIDQTVNCATSANTTKFRAQLAVADARLLVTLARLCKMGVEETDLTGYYDPMGAWAGPVYGLTAAEVAWYRDRLNDVNRVLATDARLFPNTTYVSFAGALDPTAGDVIPGVLPGAFHPTAQGQNKLSLRFS